MTAPTTIAVDPKIYYQAAINCFDAAAALFDTFTYIFGELHGYGMMAGRDEDGRTWAASYDKSAQDAVSFYGQTYKTLRAYGTALNDLGHEHAKSDALLKGTAQPERPADKASTATFGPYALPASAAGGTPQGLAQTAIEVLDAINCPLPDGDTDTLAKAADAWDRLGRLYQNTNAKDKITIAVTLLDGVTSNDAPQVREDLRTLESSIGELLNTCQQISKSCLDYKAAVEELREEIKGFIESIIQEAAINVAVTVIATCVTGVGGLIAGAKAVESARRWSVKIKNAVTAWRARKLAQLKGLGETAIAAMQKAWQAVKNLASRLRPGRPKVAVEDGRLFSRFGNRTSREVLESGDHLPLNQDTIKMYAEKYGIDLEGVQVRIATSPDEIRYYDDYAQASASTIGDDILLTPAAFADEEALVRNLVHERVHVEQYRDGRVNSGAVRELEDEAYQKDEEFWQRHGNK